MIRRKDTLGFVDFIRGKYTFSNIIHVRNIIDEMTIDEKTRLLNCDFKQLWGEMWGSYTNGQFSGEEAQSREKFNKIKNGVFFKGCNGESKVITLRHLIETSSTHWKHAEWGFPKGRRNNQESDIDCALRENLEETGYAIKKSDVLFSFIKVNVSVYFLLMFLNNLILWSECGTNIWVNRRPYISVSPALRTAISLFFPF